jgi:putative tricarboxylic transport membrane protein
MLMVQNQDLVYSIFIGMLVANILMLFFGIKIASHFAKVLKIPYVLVGPSIVVLCMTGVFALRNNLMDLVVMLVLGGFGYLLQELDYPIAPLIIGLVLGPIAEVSLRRAMILNNFDFIAVVTQPIAGVMLLVSIFSLGYGLYGQYKNYLKHKRNLMNT